MGDQLFIGRVGVCVCVCAYGCVCVCVCLWVCGCVGVCLGARIYK